MVFQAPRQAVGEQGVGGLGLAVGAPLVIVVGLELDVFPQDVCDLVAAGRQGDNPRALRCLQQRHQGVGEREMAHMVDAELGFPARADPRLRTGHDAGIVDQQVEVAVAVADLPGEPAHRGQIRQIHRRHGHIAVDARQALLRLVRRADRHDDRGPLGRKRAHRLQPDAAIAAGDDGGLARKVDVGEHLVGRALGVKAGLGRHLIG